MLFLSDLLKFKTAFGKLWLAGTVGVKKRPFNKDIIINSEIEEFVEALFNLDVPLAPRLSGTLLCGVCNIYDQKTYFLYLDVLSLFRKLYHDQGAPRKIMSEAPVIRRRKAKHSSNKLVAAAIETGNDEAPLPEIEAILADLDIDNLTLLPDDTEHEQHALDFFVRSQLQNTAKTLAADVEQARNAAAAAAMGKVPEFDETSLYVVDDNILVPESELFNQIRVKNTTLSNQHEIHSDQSPTKTATTLEHSQWECCPPDPEKVMLSTNVLNETLMKDKEDEGINVNAEPFVDETANSDTLSTCTLIIDPVSLEEQEDEHEGTPPPLDQEFLGEQLNRVASVEESTEENVMKRHQRQRRRLQPLTVDIETTLPDLVLNEWRKDCAAINKKNVSKELLLRRRKLNVELSPPPRLSRILRHVSKAAAAGSCLNSKERITNISVETPDANNKLIHEPAFTIPRTIDMEEPVTTTSYGEDGALFEGIERLRGGNIDQSTEDGGSANTRQLQFLRGTHTRQSLQTNMSEGVLVDEYGLQQQALYGRDSITTDEPINTSWRRGGSIMSHDFGSGLLGSSSSGDSGKNTFNRLGQSSRSGNSDNPRFSTSSVWSMRTNEQQLCSSSSYPGELLVETATQSAVCHNMAEEEVVLRDLQSSYTMETWKFRTFLESLLNNGQKKDTRGDSRDQYVQQQTLPFSKIVPPRSSNSLEAARSFYHILVLASSGDIDVTQKFGSEIEISQASCSLSDADNEELSTYQHCNKIMESGHLRNQDIAEHECLENSESRRFNVTSSNHTTTSWSPQHNKMNIRQKHKKSTVVEQTPVNKLRSSLNTRLKKTKSLRRSTLTQLVAPVHR